MRNFRLERAIQRLKDIVNEERIPLVWRQRFEQILHDVELGVEDLEDRIIDFESLWNRNPSFPGDYIGNWDDDDDDEDDHKDDTV